MKLAKEQIKFLNDVCYGRENWTLNSKGEVDVKGNVDIIWGNLTEIPVKFGRVEGGFDCSFHSLKSLIGAPTYVEGGFDCSNNNLTSLEFCPTSVGCGFYCGNNQLTSLIGAPTSVGGKFDCSNNQLTSLEFVPTSVGGDFWCDNNQLTNYFKNIKEEDFPYWNNLYWYDVLDEYPFLINIYKKGPNRFLKKYLNKFPQTKLYLG